uniref:tRNA/rRNA methyltransferase slr0955 n=1 Tax=Planktothrix pseudagardhii TaxID=132604 RepID=A0A9W4G4H9_9CYAN|nr:putative tRNA/rRNA methyltransferase slr0955 [Planktothrix pseudagardhii]
MPKFSRSNSPSRSSKKPSNRSKSGERDNNKSSRFSDDRKPSRFSDDRKPSRFSDDRKPSRFSDDRKPSRFSDDRKPSRFSDDRKPSRFSDDRKPSRFSDDRNSSRFSDDRKPSRFSDDRKPSRFSDDRKPSRFSDDRKPSRFSDDRKPSRFSDDRKSSRFSDDRKSSRFSDDRKSSRFSDDRKSYRFSDEQSDNYRKSAQDRKESFASSQPEQLTREKPSKFLDERQPQTHRHSLHSPHKSQRFIEESKPEFTDESVESFDVENELIYGRRTVQSALENERSLSRIWVVSQLKSDPRFFGLLQTAKANGAILNEVTYQRLDQVTQGANHQGIAAQISPYSYKDLNELIETAKATSSQPVVIVADGIQDPHNLGAIIRTAEAIGAQGLIVPQRRAVGVTSTVMKVAAGSLETFPVTRVINLSRALEDLKAAGFWIYGTSATATETLPTVKFNGAIALVVGNEGEGLSHLIEQKCDVLVSIPLSGETASLNVSVATGMALYEIYRQRNFQASDFS